MITETQLLKLKREVDEAKTKVSELTGHKTALLKQLRDDWGCKTTDDGEKKLKELQASVTKLDNQIKTGITELEEKYEIN